MSENSSPLTRDERMWCGARDGCTFEMIEGMAVFGATGGNPSGSRPNFFGRQHLTFDKGRAWMPEVERPKALQDAKPTERSLGKGVGGFCGIVRFWEG